MLVQREVTAMYVWWWENLRIETCLLSKINMFIKRSRKSFSVWVVNTFECSLTTNIVQSFLVEFKILTLSPPNLMNAKKCGKNLAV